MEGETEFFLQYSPYLKCLSKGVLRENDWVWFNLEEHKTIHVGEMQFYARRIAVELYIYV